MSGAWAVALKELRQIHRDRRALLILAFVPAFFLFLYGYALNFDIRHVALGVEDRDGTAESRRLVSTFVDSGYFDVVGTLTSDADGDALLNRGAARALLVIPAGFARDVQERRTADVQV